MRGPAYGLVEQLRPVLGDARQARLADLQAHYGLRLKLVPKDSLSLTAREQALLNDGLLVVRGDFMEFLATIDGGPQLLEIKLPEEPKWLYLWAYGFLGVCLAIVLYFGTPALARPGAYPPGRPAFRRQRPGVTHPAAAPFHGA